MNRVGSHSSQKEKSSWNALSLVIIVLGLIAFYDVSTSIDYDGFSLDADYPGAVLIADLSLIILAVATVVSRRIRVSSKVYMPLVVIIIARFIAKNFGNGSIL